jgi:hypothetical protein
MEAGGLGFSGGGLCEHADGSTPRGPVPFHRGYGLNVAARHGRRPPRENGDETEEEEEEEEGRHKVTLVERERGALHLE